METVEIIKLVALVVVGYVVLRFVWNLVGGLLKLLIITVLVGVGVYIVKPDILYDTFGKDNVENTVSVVKDRTQKGIEYGKEKLKDVAKDSLGK